MSTAQDKARLLRSLAIDRGGSTPSRAPSRRWPITVALGSASALILVSAAALAPQLRPDRPIDEAVARGSAQPPAPQPTSAPTLASAASRPAGLLTASGYVVARRKATVAAEITGKIVAVLVEEGMVVDEGQVVAKLDSVLAEKDLDLAKSRADSAEAAIAVISADLEDANRILARARVLWQRNAASEADLTRPKRGRACSAHSSANPRRNSKLRASTRSAPPPCWTNTRSAPP